MENQRKDGGGSSKPPQAAPPPDSAAGGAGRIVTTRQQQHVKVKHIVTTEVSTDEASFKDVVQSLTGKDSGAVVAAGGMISRSNDDALVGGAAAGIVDNYTVARVLPSSEEGVKWFWRGA